MEKNGAISSNTPRCGGNCGCFKTKNAAAADAPGQQTFFPQSQSEADQIDNDLIKSAADAVKKASL